MDARISVITLAVEDLERASRFYRDVLGFRPGRIVGSDWTDEATGARGEIGLFELDGGLVLSLYPRSELAKDAEIGLGPAHSGEFSLGHLVRDRDQVDELMAVAGAAGAAVTPAHDRPWGIYSGYFRDLDGHLWEIIHQPSRTPP